MKELRTILTGVSFGVATASALCGWSVIITSLLVACGVIMVMEALQG